MQSRQNFIGERQYRLRQQARASLSISLRQRAFHLLPSESRDAATRIGETACKAV